MDLKKGGTQIADATKGDLVFLLSSYFYMKCFSLQVLHIGK